ncbi:hypothetical protein BGW41_003815 [Actinomortierella wolfii]|nr:hypothetical protein BGW41_003815 [Actinomortierella wolfii]
MIPYIVSRVVCYVAGYLYPAYASYKAIKSRNSARLQAWLMYWTVLGMYTMVEYVADMVVFWLPFYYDIKILFILWMMLPQTQGSLYIYQVFVEPYLASHEQDIDKTLQDAQRQARAMGLEYIKRGIAALQKAVIDIVSKAATGNQQFVSSEAVQKTAVREENAGGSQPAPATGAQSYFSWAYSMVSPKLTAVATMASQTVSRQLPSRPLPRPPVNLYNSATSESDTSSQSSGLGITTPVSPEDQKRLDQLSKHLETAASYLLSSSSSSSGGIGSSTGANANPTANATSDVRRRMLSLYGEESEQE